MLLLLTFTTLLFGDCSSHEMLPLTLEISALIPIVVIFLNRKRFLAHQISQSKKCSKQLFAQGAESAVVSTRVTIIIAFLHFFAIFIAILLPGPLSETSRNVLFLLLPTCCIPVKHIVQPVWYSVLQYHDEAYSFCSRL